MNYANTYGIENAIVTVKTEKQIYAAVVGENGGFFFGGAMRRELPTLHCRQEDHVIKFQWAFRTRAGAIRFAIKELEKATAYIGAPYQALPVEKKQSVAAQRRSIWNHA